MSCKACHMNNDEYVGDLFELTTNIDGGSQYFEAYIFDSPEDECHVLEINGTYTELRFEINFCPICGRKL